MKKKLTVFLFVLLVFKVFAQTDTIVLPDEKPQNGRFSFGVYGFVQKPGNKYGDYIHLEEGLGATVQYGFPFRLFNKEVGVSGDAEIGQIIPNGKWKVGVGTIFSLYGGVWISIPIKNDFALEPELDYGFNHRGLEINDKKAIYNDQLFRAALNINYSAGEMKDEGVTLFITPYVQVVPFKNNPTGFFGAKVGVTYNFRSTIQTGRRLKSKKKLENDLSTLALSDITVRSSKTGLVIGLENIKFKPNSAELIESEKIKIQKVAGILSSFTNKLLVIGYCAETGVDDDNLRISAERAGTVGDYLVKLKVRKAEDITVIGRGALNPLASNDTDAGRSNNRRVEITILDR